MDDYRSATGNLGRYGQEHYFRSGAGAPISIDGQLWGMAFVAKTGNEKLPPRAEERLAQFTDLVATAIANSEARSELHRKAEEQSALRRVATLVAQAATPAMLFDAVAEEIGELLGVDRTFLGRYEDDDTVSLLARWSKSGDHLKFPGPTSTSTGTLASAVRDTGRPARIDCATGDSASMWAKWNIHCAAGAPITVGGRLWGLLGAACTQEPRRGTEERLAEFADLVTTAIANAEARAELTASRARIVASAVDARRRIERDLHDGAQQRLVSLVLQLKAVRASVPPDQQNVGEELDQVATELTDTINELRELARGIHPAILTEGGLLPAIKALARRSGVPVALEVSVPRRFSEPVEEAAYYIIAEALTNATKHARASTVDLHVHVESDVLHVSIRDDGVGGISPTAGPGLIGLRDRAEALGGCLDVSSPAGDGTQLLVRLPLHDTEFSATSPSPAADLPQTSRSGVIG
jgi:signal transduction histidine kinase